MTSQLYYGRNPVTLSIDDFIVDMDAGGIDKVVLVNTALKGSPMRMLNEGVAKLLKRYPERFIGFAGFDPNTGEQAVQDIEHAVEELGFKGIKTVSSGYQLRARAHCSKTTLFVYLYQIAFTRDQLFFVLFYHL